MNPETEFNMQLESIDLFFSPWVSLFPWNFKCTKFKTEYRFIVTIFMQILIYYLWKQVGPLFFNRIKALNMSCFISAMFLHNKIF